MALPTAAHLPVWRFLAALLLTAAPRIGRRFAAPVPVAPAVGAVSGGR